MLFLFNRNISGKEFKIFPPLFFGFDKPVLAIPNLAHLLLPSADINAVAKSKELNSYPQQIGVLRTFVRISLRSVKGARLLAAGIFCFILLLSQNSFAQMGGTAQDIINQTNRQAAIQMGSPLPQIPPSDPYLAHQFIINQYNSQKNNNAQSRHLEEIMNEVNEIDQRYNNSYPINNSEILSSYQKSFSQINDMLIGKTKLSFNNAIYYMEAAYGSSYLDYSEYQKSISQSADFIKKWLQQNNIPLVPQNIHYAIQQFMGDTMSVTIKLPDQKKESKTITHLPFKYDYEDYMGKNDYRNYFATKCLATGTGQCSSMPDVYLLLCEALGVKGYKTFAPFHSFIKYKNQNGKLVNYEPTSHWTITDKWYQENLSISQKAKMNGIYLDTLNKKQAVANSIIDLAISYMLQTNNPDTSFILNCLNTANKYFPKKNNLSYYLAKSSLLSRQLSIALKQHNAKDISEAKNYPDTNNLYNKLLENETYLSNLGYQALPQNMYDNMIEQQNNKTKDPNAKAKKSLFITN